jgi:hypothetical protein
MFLLHIKAKFFPVHKGDFSTDDRRTETIKGNKLWSFACLAEFVMDIGVLDLGSGFAAEH